MTEKEKELWSKIQDLERETKRLTRELGEARSRSEFSEIQSKLREKEEREAALRDALDAQEKRLRILETQLQEPEETEPEEEEPESKPVRRQPLWVRWL
jgi:predicted RNase H-like nuclease (RuvC/YqgF family)